LKPHGGCPVAATANVFAGKWKVPILWHLAQSSRRFAELRKRIPGVSEKVLAEQLRELEQAGAISRHSDGGQPARVDYSLTPAGAELIPVMQAMCDWGAKHLGVMPTLGQLTPGALKGSRFAPDVH
jgi:DNA-binding HxlR family transcriptional regulator